MLKKILTGLGILLALGAIILGFLLVPAHLQIRDVEPELPTKADLANLRGSPDGPTKISYFETSNQFALERTLGHSTFVIEWEDGKILLIDLGMDRATAVKFGELFETIGGADPAVPLGTVPEFLGDDLSRVKGIGFTHLHSDHVQGIEPVCAATDQKLTVLHTSDQLTKHNLHPAEQADLLSKSSCVVQQELASDARSSEQFPGIGIYPLGGHTPGSTMFAVPVGDTVWLLTGDISNVHANLIENRGKGFMYSYLMVPENVDRQAELRQLLAGFDKDPNITQSSRMTPLQ
jgi:glyoxylase-like metal-dependent hydrolase (beta-lactamase superfamily II)